MQLFVARKAIYEEAMVRHALGLPVEARPVDGPTLVGCAEAFLKTRALQVDTNGDPVEPERRWNQRKLGIMTCLSTVRAQKVKFVELLKAEDIDAMVIELRTRPTEKGTPLAPSTVRGYVMELRAMITELFEKGRLAQHPFRHATMVPKEAERSALNPRLYLTRDEMRRLLDQVVNCPQVPYAFELASVFAYTGMRKEEAMGLLVGDVDLELEMVYVRANEYRKGKGENARREIPLWPRLRDRLAALIRGKSADDLVFPSGVAPRLNPAATEEQPIDSIDGTLAAAARRAGIAKRVTHQTLRHTYASARMQMMHRTVTGTLVPVDRELIVSEVGHADAEMLKIVYAHVTRDRNGQLLLDYGEQDLAPEARVEIGAKEQSARRAAGYAARSRRRAAGHVEELMPTTDAEKRERKLLVRKIREHARQRGWSEADTARSLQASPADVTAIMRGDISRLPLSRVRMYAAALS
ncbi:MAG: tyrosine-type recombinase/integrase [Gemmatimonadaceae bacterium]|nr:tyrosine-type recombinase/integrase [Gemmatimonadaceae bacterium]